ncbi:unnamed protein product [Mytilus edulis]|uniref:Endonuclease/exonuclease/phosphatase domain-containing protein n=1 Tax=Mytilus edulis TaxID=6550 RepID=A0A8S3R3G1_MYTED|nr:unnamed protein product [Mytilus edulis]
MDKSIVNFSKTSISDLNKINAITSMTNAGNFTMNDNLSVAVTESDNGTYESNDEVINLQCTDTNVLCNPPEALSPVDFKLCFSIGLSVLVTACLFALLNNNCYLLPNLQETSEGKDNVYDFSLTKVYRPPSSLINWIDEFEKEITTAINHNSDIILVGDFNIDFLKPNKQPQKWLSLLETYNLNQIIQEATRVTPDSSTLIDHVYVTNKDLILESHVAKFSISDHYPVCLTRKEKNSTYIKKDIHTTISYRNFKKFNETNFLSDISNINNQSYLSSRNIT